MFPHINMGLFRHRSPRSPHGWNFIPVQRKYHHGPAVLSGPATAEKDCSLLEMLTSQEQVSRRIRRQHIPTQWRLWCTHWHHDINGYTIFWLLVWFTKYPAFENLWSLGSVLGFVVTWVFLLLVHQQCNAAVTATASGLLPHPLLGRFGRHLRHKAATRHTWHAWHLWHIWHIWLHMSVFVYRFVLHTYVKYTCILYLCNLHVKYT